MKHSINILAGLVGLSFSLTDLAVAQIPAQIVQPANGSTLTSSSVFFQWSGGSFVSQYWLRLGTTFGGRELVDRSMGLATSTTVTNLPINGQPIHATLFSLVGGQWQYYTYQYGTRTAAVAARISSPIQGSTLPASVTFQWAPVNGAQQYWLQLGANPDGYEIFSRSTGLGTSVLVTNIPQNGRPVHAKLWTAIGGLWYASAAQYTAGSLTATDFMLDFDGVDDFVLLPVDASETSYTVSLWFRTTNPNCGLFMASNSDAASHDRNIYLRGGNLHARVWADETIATSGQNFADGNWHQVTHIFGGAMGGQKLFVDGQLRQSGSLAKSAFGWQTHLRVGFAWGADKAYFQGQIYSVCLWDRALGATEIASLYRQNPSLSDPNLSGYWTFDEAQGSNDVLNTAPRGASVRGTLGGTNQVAADDPKRVAAR